ncbi:hypothetical protein BVX98_01155 [bacterium F11]|nr:hypothetical protein BVX98_01155 [bacterium F11]
MTELLTAHIGGYPRIGEGKDHQRHRRALHHLQQKEISTHAFRDVEQSVLQEIVREQLTSDVDEVTDGHVSWHDPISHFTRNVSGIRRGGLQRFFDTNTYYRVPVFYGKPKRKAYSVFNDFIFTQNHSYRTVRVVLTGPYTLARLSRSESRTFDSLKSRLSFFVDLIKSEIRALVRSSVKVIQIDEPAFPFYPEDIHLFHNAMQSILQICQPARTVLHFSFSPLSPIYEHLLSLPVDILSLDFTYDGKKLIEKLQQTPPPMGIGFGLINGRNTRLEAIDPLIRLMKNWLEKTTVPITYLSPSCGLDYLPRPFAFEKLKLLSKIKEEINANKKVGTN